MVENNSKTVENAPKGRIFLPYLFPEFFLPPLAMAAPLMWRDLTWRLLLLLPELEPEPLRWRCGCSEARFTLVGCGVGAANST